MDPASLISATTTSLRQPGDGSPSKYRGWTESHVPGRAAERNSILPVFRRRAFRAKPPCRYGPRSAKITAKEHANYKPPRNHRFLFMPGHRVGCPGRRAECGMDHPQLARERAAVFRDCLFRADYCGDGGEYDFPGPGVTAQ